MSSAVTDSNQPDSGAVNAANSFNEQFLQILRGVSNQQNSGAVNNSLLLMSQQFAAALASAQHCANNTNSNNNSPIASASEKPPKTPKKYKPRKLKDSENALPPSTTQNRKKLQNLPTAVIGTEPPTTPLLDKDPIGNLWQGIGAKSLDNNDNNIAVAAAAAATNIKSEVEENNETNLLLLDYESNQLTTMPKESEIAERKRPAAIQELLQMKKARLNNNNNNSEKIFFKKEQSKEVDGQESATTMNDDENQASTACSTLKEIFQRLCNNQEEDAETTSSTHSTISHHSITMENGHDTSKNMSEQLLVALQQQQHSQKNFPNNTPSSNNNNNKKNNLESVENGVYLTPTRIPIRANDNVTESPLSSLIPHDRIFAKVPGRLSLLSNVVKYDMSLGEVKRRLMGPEKYNFSLLGALLRRAKMPEKSQMLIGELEQVGLSIPRGRRRNTQITLLSALTEAEAVQFAKDFQLLANTEFPSRLLAELAVKRELVRDTPIPPINNNGFSTEFSDEKTLLKTRREQIETSLKMSQEFLDLLGEDRSPVMNSNPEPIFERNLQDPLSTFSMLTHGFGNPGILVGVQMFVAFLNNQLNFINEQNPTPNENSL